MPLSLHASDMIALSLFRSGYKIFKIHCKYLWCEPACDLLLHAREAAEEQVYENWYDELQRPLDDSVWTLCINWKQSNFL